MVVTVTGLTRNPGEDFTTSTTNNRNRGFVYWNEYWRAVEWNTGLLRAMGDDGTTESAQNIDLDTILGFVSSGSRFISGLTTDGTNLIALENNQTDQTITIHVINTSNEVVSSNQITIPTGITGLSGIVNSIAYDTNTQNVWVGYNGTTGNRVRFINYSTDGTNISNGFLGITGHITSTGSTIWNEILFSGSSDTDRLYAYELNGSNISTVNNTTTDSVQGLGKRGNILFASDQNNSVDAYDIDFTSVPEDPTGLAGSEVSGEVALTWDDPSDDTITGYKIFRKTGTGAYSTLVENTASTLQSYTDDTVAEGTEYTYKIQAINNTGNSGDSNEFNITTASTGTVPDAPTGLTGTENTDGEVVLTWDDPSDDTITDHAIFRKVGNGTYTELTTTALITGQTYTDDTAVAGTGYTYKIKAINATGNSADSNEFPFTTAVADTTAPRPETGVPASADVTTVEVSWRVTFSEDVQNVDETDFGIKRVGIANFNPDSVTQISASIYDVFGTLPEPDVYHLRLRGTSDITDLSGNLRSGTGEISGSTITYTASTIDPPDAPTGLALTEDNPTEVTVTWTVSTDETITDYNIYRGEVFGGPYTLLVDIVFDVTTDEGSYVDDTAEFDTTYYYVIRAENDGGESDNSTEVGITTDEEVAEDTTAPTFTIDGNDDDFDTTLELGNTYTEFEFRNKVDVDTNLDDTIIYKNSSGAVITSFDGIAPSEGSYTIEYTLTDDADNSTTIVESLTVEDTTNPTFEVDDNTAAFATTVAYNGTYTVKAITDIVDASTTVSTITGNTAVDTSTAGDYLVTYTVTDESANANATSIVETVTVSEEVITTGDELLTFTDNAEVPIPELGQSHYTERTITIPDEYDGTISNLILDLDITHPAGYDIRIELESPNGTNIRVVNYDTSSIVSPWDEEPFELDDWNGEMTAGVWTLKINDGFADANEGTLHSWELRISTEEGLDNSEDAPVETVPDSPSSVTAIEVSGDVVLEWVDASDDSITGYKIFRKTGTGAFTTLVTDTASTTLTYTDTTVSVDTDYTYKIQAINDVGNSGDSHEVTITTDPAPDVTAPTFTVEANGDDNTANFTTTVAFNGTYTVGTIADISETGTTSVISGNTDVDIGTAGEYTVTYTVTDTSGNSTEIVETITVSEEVITDSTAPTFDVDGNTEDYDTELTDDETYDVGTVDNIIDDGTTTTSDPVYKDSTGAVISSFDNTMLSAGDYSVEYTVTDDSDNAYTIIESITVTEAESDTDSVTLTDIVANTTNNFELVAANADPEGLCFHQNYWRSVDDDTLSIHSYLASDPTVTLPTIALHSDNSVPIGITSDGTYMYVADFTDKVFVYDADGYVRQFNITLPVEYTPNAIACDVDNNRLWVSAYDGVAAQNRFYAFTIPESGVTTVAPISSLTFDGVAGSLTSTFQGIIFFEGYLVTITTLGTFYVYNTADNSLVSGIDLDLTGSYYGLGRNGDTVYASPNDSDTVQAFTLVYTSAALDTTAPTFEVDDNDADYATTVVFGGTYTVGVISDISETGTTSVISGDDDVNTSTAGEYTVTYTVTDTAGNAGEIVETVTVSPEVIVSDTTAPTFTVKTNSADFDITIELGTVYNVGTFDDIVDEDASPSEDIVYKNSAGTTITSFDGDELSVGTYSVEYTLTDDAGNVSITIIESITVEDTTAPTFLVGTRSADFNTAVTNGNTYTVGIIGSIVEESIYSTNIDGDDDVNTSTDGEYTVTYTVTDASSNVGTIVETVTVSSTPDTTAPTITSAIPDDATLVNSINAEWLVTFSEDVQNVGTVDFFISKNGIANFTPDSLEIVSASQYRLFAELPSAGIYNLRIRGNSDISDLSDNEITQSGQISNSTITYTDTLAPTFLVKGNSNNFTTNIITGGTYTVGTIDDIVEVNVYNELISGASSVDTSIEGDYEVEYSVTDVNNNEKMIIETVTVADELVAVAGSLDFTFKYEIQKSTTTIANPNPMIVSSDKAVVK